MVSDEDQGNQNCYNPQNIEAIDSRLQIQFWPRPE